MTYPKAPIQEAVFDVRVDKVQNVDIDSYVALSKKELSSFPKTEIQTLVSGRFKFDTDMEDLKTERKDKKVTGVIFSNKESNLKIQFRKDGFTTNMLRPYSNWTDFSSVAYRYWDLYRKEVQPNRIKRIALRYINKIELPTQDLDFDDYLNDMPKIPEVFEDGFGDFYLRTLTRCKESGNIASLIRRMGKFEENILPFIVDIDVSKNSDIDIRSIQQDFEVLRKDKNKIFESLITDKTRNLFK